MAINLKNMAEVKAAREADYQAEIAAINPADTLALYWAGSASASVMRDYKAGRVSTVNADRLRRKNNLDRPNGRTHGNRPAHGEPVVRQSEVDGAHRPGDCRSDGCWRCL